MGAMPKLKIDRSMVGVSFLDSSRSMHIHAVPFCLVCMYKSVTLCVQSSTAPPANLPSSSP